ncbi:M16 family metallopeptidase [Fulvivirga sedimenti]|uniref:Insulinase family protein n=1 Tax=Fulvivirga sedimenti TaxID=2879465 RepID=A0A9X1L1J2_9BACT|nr:M16 family metallopeptidase [Fulvivirga sedimenti]MCA6078287.1 insulinase family protein [Fulvivirga sedimenti]
MKKVIWIAVWLLFPAFLYAQENQIQGKINQEIPIDPDVKVGVLENGLTYYIRHNEKPEDKVELRLVVNVGSMMEDEDQQGLAHFMEHMAFNGTRNFEKNELVSYLQSVGVKFGADLNAYTSFDETVYILPIPSDDEEILNKGLLVLEDWASNVLLTDEEIDKERGVVIEEWRLGQGANQRMRDEWFPVMFKDSRYAERLPIGKKEVLENFDYETLRKFYRDWYRPDLMAIVAVGDIDVNEMEKMIKERFGKLKNPENPRPKQLFDVPDHPETFVSVVTDKEAQFTQIQLVYKQDLEKTETVGDFRRDAVYSLYNGMLNQRLSELQESADPPFLFASSSYGNMVRTKSSYSSFAVVGENGIEKGLKTLVRENERVKKYGFTQGELDRYKKTVLNRYEVAFKEKDKTESGRYASEYIRNFLSDEPIPGIGYEYEFYEAVLPSITLEEVNGLAANWITDENRVVVIMGPDKEGLTMPGTNDILEILNEAQSEEITPYEDKELATTFIDTMPTPGKITASKELEEVEATELTLSNGMKVILKSTDFKNDEIVIRGFSMGGRSLYSEEDDLEASNAGEIVAESGVREFSPSDIEKMLSGKSVFVGAFIGTYNEGMSGSTTPEDLETALQLMHLYFTAPRKDADAFSSFVNKNKMLMQNLMASPQFFYSDKLSRILSQNHPRGGYFPTVAEMESIDFDRSFEIYTERFANAGDFTFFFVGNFDIEQIKPMLELYLGSLPGSASTESYKDLGIRPPAGPLKEEIKKGTDPKSTVTMIYTGPAAYDLDESYYLSSLGEVLSNKLIEILREEKGGVYGVGANGSMTKIPYENYTFRIGFPCSPENTQDLINAALAEVEKIKKEGVSDEDLQKIKESQRRERKEELERNSYWVSALFYSYYYDLPLERVKNFNEKIDALTSDKLKETAKKYLTEDHFIQVVLMPEDN